LDLEARTLELRLQQQLLTKDLTAQERSLLETIYKEQVNNLTQQYNNRQKIAMQAKAQLALDKALADADVVLCRRWLRHRTDQCTDRRRRREPEYVIPASKMRGAMSRYAGGARGNNVIPGSGAEGGTEQGGGTAVATPIDVRYTVERINSVDYVTADQFQTGMAQAAQQGARQGEQSTLRRLQQSSSTRRRLGM
jgi:hypothetical protein